MPKEENLSSAGHWIARRGRALQKAVTLGAVGAVVVLVSLPQLRAFALRENETDALGLIRLLGGSGVVLAASDAEGGVAGAAGGAVSGAEGGVAEPGAQRAGLNLVDWTQDDPRLRIQTLDLESLDGGRRIRRHGYLFDVLPGAEGPALRAWPWEHGRTGFGAFVLTADGVLRGHANSGAIWSGELHAPEGPWSPAAGWRVLPVHADYR